MNDIHDDPAGQTTSGARRDAHQDLDRLRRSTTDRYVAGVAGGLGRHFNIDPNIVRVLLVVLTFFGGAGLLIYGVCWLLVPEDNVQDAPVRVGPESRTVILLIAAAVAVLLVLGDAFSGFDGGWALAIIALLVAIMLIARDRRDQQDGPPVPPPGTPTGTVGAASVHPAAPTAFGHPAAGPTTFGPTAFGPTGPAGTATGAPAPAGSAPAAASASASTAVAEPAPPAWQPPSGRPAMVQPSPRRTGILWFWPTLALIAIGLGVLAIVDNSTTDIPAGAYPALALAISGVMLLVGAFVGRPGGVILLGVLSSLALAVTSVLGDFHFDAHEVKERPTSAAAVEPSYTTHNGRIELDLTGVRDPEALAGRDLDVSLNAGEVVVYVPRSLNVDLDAEIGFLGGIRVPGYDGGGFEASVERRVTAEPASTAPALDLDLDVRIGQITVEVR